jgi:hypothetical protein
MTGEKQSRKNKLEVRKKLNASANGSPIFDGRGLFWALCARQVALQKRQDKPIEGFNSSDWDAFAKHLLNEYSASINGILIELNLTDTQRETRRIWERKRISAAAQFNKALAEFVATHKEINQLANENPGAHKTYWEELTNWAVINQNQLSPTSPSIALNPNSQTSTKPTPIAVFSSSSVEAFDVDGAFQRAMFTTKALEKVSKAIGTGSYKMGLGDYPSADVSDGQLTTISEIRPLPHEMEHGGLPTPLKALQERTLAVAEKLQKQTGGYAVLLFNSLLFMWFAKAKGTGNDTGSALLTIHEICEYMNLPRRSDRPNLFTRPAIKNLQENIQALARVSVDVKDGKLAGYKNPVQYQEQILTISPLAKQDDLWQTGAWDSEWLAINIRIGQFARYAVGDENQFAPLPSVSGIDPRKKVEMLLGWFLSRYLRVNASRSSVVRLTVGITLETLGLKKVADSKERLETALDFIVELGDLIRSWQYEGESIDAKLYRRQIETGKATRMSPTDLATWLNSKIVVEASEGLAKQYEKLSIARNEKKVLEYQKAKLPVLPAPRGGLAIEVRQVIHQKYGGSKKQASEDIGIDASTLGRFLNGNRIRANDKIVQWLDKIASGELQR